MKIVDFVDLSTDCSRRDLTINSMAIDTLFLDEHGNEDGIIVPPVVDPFNGRVDLTAKVLRHTSDAFREDPVRVLRLARLRARFGAEWKVAPETQALVSQMAKNGVLNELQSERVWKEMSRALMEPFPRLFFDTLLEVDALHVVFPEVYKLKTALESYRWHPEGNAYEHTMLVLTQAALHNFSLDTRLACVCHDFGKALTPRHKLPKHHGHDINGVPVTEEFCNRLTVPSKMRDHAMLATRYHMAMHHLDDMNPKTVVQMLDAMGARQDARVVEVLHEVGVCDERGRLGSENNDTSHVSRLLSMFDAYMSVKFADVFPNGETNVNKIKDGLYKARVHAVRAA